MFIAIANSALTRGIHMLALGVSRMEASVERARKDDGGFGAQAAMISGGLIGIAVILVLALRNTAGEAEDVLNAADLANTALTANSL